MRHRVVAGVGYFFVGLLLVGLAVQVVIAWKNNIPFIGENYKGLPIGTYSTAAVLAALALFGLFWIGKGLRSLVRRGLSKT